MDPDESLIWLDQGRYERTSDRNPRFTVRSGDSSLVGGLVPVDSVAE